MGVGRVSLVDRASAVEVSLTRAVVRVLLVERFAELAFHLIARRDVFVMTSHGPRLVGGRRADKVSANEHETTKAFA